MIYEVYMSRYLLSLPDNKFEEVRETAESKGISIAQFIREAIDGALCSNYSVPCGIILSGGVAISGYLPIIIDY